jgi:hypothetical protein
MQHLVGVSSRAGHAAAPCAVVPVPPSRRSLCVCRVPHQRRPSAVPEPSNETRDIREMTKTSIGTGPDLAGYGRCHESSTSHWPRQVGVTLETGLMASVARSSAFSGGMERAWRPVDRQPASSRRRPEASRMRIGLRCPVGEQTPGVRSYRREWPDADSDCDGGFAGRCRAVHGPGPAAAAGRAPGRAGRTWPVRRPRPRVRPGAPAAAWRSGRAGPRTDGGTLCGGRTIGVCLLPRPVGRRCDRGRGRRHRHAAHGLRPGPGEPAGRRGLRHPEPRRLSRAGGPHPAVPAAGLARGR